MKTKAQLITECKDDNPTMMQSINVTEIQLTGADYDQACADWADMKLAQLKDQAEIDAKAEAKAAAQAKLAALGLTVGDLQALGL